MFLIGFMPVGNFFTLQESSSCKVKTLRVDAHSCIWKMSLRDCNWRGKSVLPDIK
jgi:hypothetical protein